LSISRAISFILSKAASNGKLLGAPQPRFGDFSVRQQAFLRLDLGGDGGRETAGHRFAATRRLCAAERGATGPTALCCARLSRRGLTGFLLHQCRPREV
jgi:hypothetical protein